MKKRSSTRRTFIKRLGSSAVMASVPGILASKQETKVLNLPQRPQKIYAPNDTIRIAIIGAGGMGQGDARTAMKVGGCEIVAACDLYEGRLQRCKENWGDHIFTTRDYREILDRKDVDAVICGTSDHWHAAIAVDAMKAGKAVYCEKPMTQTVEGGHAVIKAEKETGAVFQVGSQYVSSLVHDKSKALLEAGEIGKLNFAEALMDRHNVRGAWQYAVPRDANEKTVDWKRYISNTTKRKFDPHRFFRWRNYTDYGTGVAGDLFVHMLSMLHFSTSSLGPNKVASMGGLRHFHDGREVPDIQLGLYEYSETEQHPAFNLSLRANFVDGSGGNFLFRLVGDEGEIRVGRDNLILTRHPWAKRPKPSMKGFSKAGEKAYMKWWEEENPVDYAMEAPRTMEYRVPENYPGDRYLHFQNFFNSIREGKPVVEDASFGLRAAGPTLAGNKSFAENKMIGWDPVNMKMIP